MNNLTKGGNAVSLKIDSEFKGLLPPLADEEYKKLEHLLVTQGCLDTIKTWNGYIIDGHNRYEICTRRKVHFDTQEISFNSREDVIDWIYDYQFGKRNMNDSQKAYLRGKQYERMKKRKEDTLKQNAPMGKNTPTVRTSQKLAEIHKVDERTIREDEKYAKAIDSIGENVGQEVKRKILNRELVVPKKDVVKIGVMPSDEQKKMFDTSGKVIKVKEGKPAMPKSGKLETKEKEDAKKEVPQTETSQNSLPISLRHIQLLVNNFLADADRYLFMPDYTCKLTAEEKLSMLTEIEQVKDWYEKFKIILKN